MSFTVIGTGSALPAFSADNSRLSEFLDTSDEWIRSRTGIGERRICTGESVTELAVHAALLSLEQAGILPADVGLIICATMSGDNAIPSLACSVQEALGASCPAFDINAACSGFVYALDTAAGYFSRGRTEYILVVAAEAMSRVVDWSDRSTCVLFGDGAGAVVLRKGEDLLAIRLTSKGDGKTLSVAGPRGNCPFAETPAPSPYLAMDGKEVYRFAVSSVTRDITDVIAMAGLSQGDVGFVLLHQANQRIIDAAASRLRIPREKYACNISRYGNTSAASIPILLDEINREGRLKPGSILVLAAFGGGLTTGACVLRWNMPDPCDRP